MRNLGHASRHKALEATVLRTAASFRIVVSPAQYLIREDKSLVLLVPLRAVPFRVVGLASSVGREEFPFPHWPSLAQAFFVILLVLRKGWVEGVLPGARGTPRLLLAELRRRETPVRW